MTDASTLSPLDQAREDIRDKGPLIPVLEALMRADPESPVLAAFNEVASDWLNEDDLHDLNGEANGPKKGG